jgi:D-proline reductase (dithiol) PrdB
VLESHGLTTVNLSINLDISRKINAPRTVFVRFPHGAPFGEPHARDQQMTVLRDLLRAAQELATPGTIVEPGYRWRRTVFDPVSLSSFVATGFDAPRRKPPLQEPH